MSYLHNISSFAWDILFFKVTLELHHFIGSIMILAGVFIISILRAIGYEI